MDGSSLSEVYWFPVEGESGARPREPVIFFGSLLGAGPLLLGSREDLLLEEETLKRMLVHQLQGKRLM